ncbi:MAG: YggT family protein [Hyphomicrobiaceae bacterium]|nr:YggT family protein [Hyphomicrobiaceae bacterium]
MLPVLQFIDFILIDLLIWIIIASAVMSWLIAFNVINPYNQFVRTLWTAFNAVTEPLLRPIRRLLPDMRGIDISPVVLILILMFIRIVVLRGWLYPLFQ